MKTKTVSINGKQVTLGYCYATEINYSLFTDGENAAVFISEAATKLDAMTKGGTDMPDIKKCIYIILAAALAVSESKGEECIITDQDLLYTDNPTELYEALAQVILIYGEFYKIIPAEQPKKKGKAGKN